MQKIFLSGDGPPETGVLLDELQVRSWSWTRPTEPPTLHSTGLLPALTSLFLPSNDYGYLLTAKTVSPFFFV